MGIPTHDTAGQPLSKNLLKNLKKEYETQKKAYDKYMASQSGDEKMPSDESL
jgi:hypothetical protein